MEACSSPSRELLRESPFRRLPFFLLPAGPLDYPPLTPHPGIPNDERRQVAAVFPGSPRQAGPPWRRAIERMLIRDGGTRRGHIHQTTADRRDGSSVDWRAICPKVGNNSTLGYVIFPRLSVRRRNLNSSSLIRLVDDMSTEA